MGCNKEGLQSSQLLRTFTSIDIDFFADEQKYACIIADGERPSLAAALEVYTIIISVQVLILVYVYEYVCIRSHLYS